MNRIGNFFKVMKEVWWATGRKNKHIFVYGTNDKELIDKFVKLTEGRDKEYVRKEVE